MQRSGASLLRSLHSRGFCTPPASSDKIVASVLFERLPLVVPKIDPNFYAFQQFSFKWGKMSGGKKKEQNQPDPALENAEAMVKSGYEVEFKQVPWSGNADRTNNKRSPLRALDRRLYLLLYGCPYGATSKKPVWHFPEKLYESERTLRECAESALKTVIGDLDHASFVGNAPMAHLAVKPEGVPDIQSIKRFFFKSQVVGINKFHVVNCEDFVWVSKEELLEYFPEQAGFFKKMIIC